MGKNQLISLLSKKKQDSFLKKTECIELNLSEIIYSPNKRVDYIYFPVDGFISITQSLAPHPPLEIGMVGREGLLGAETILGLHNSPFGALVQGAGTARSISVPDFLNHAQNDGDFRALVLLYLAVRTAQLGQSIACEHFHEISPRLANWLLMSQDRAQAATFFMTHEFISLMLGVRRVGVTSAAADFKRRGLINYSRGEIRILDRVGLKAEACTCYQRNRKIYSSLIH